MILSLPGSYRLSLSAHGRPLCLVSGGCRDGVSGDGVAGDGLSGDGEAVRERKRWDYAQTELHLAGGQSPVSPHPAGQCPPWAGSLRGGSQCFCQDWGPGGSPFH